MALARGSTQITLPPTTSSASKDPTTAPPKTRSTSAPLPATNATGTALAGEDVADASRSADGASANNTNGGSSKTVWYRSAHDSIVAVDACFTTIPDPRAPAERLRRRSRTTIEAPLATRTAGVPDVDPVALEISRSSQSVALARPGTLATIDPRTRPSVASVIEIAYELPKFAKYESRIAGRRSRVDFHAWPGSVSPATTFCRENADRETLASVASVVEIPVWKTSNAHASIVSDDTLAAEIPLGKFSNEHRSTRAFPSRTAMAD